MWIPALAISWPFAVGLTGWDGMWNPSLCHLQPGHPLRHSFTGWRQRRTNLELQSWIKASVNVFDLTYRLKYIKVRQTQVRQIIKYIHHVNQSYAKCLWLVIRDYHMHLQHWECFDVSGGKWAEAKMWNVISEELNPSQSSMKCSGHI